MSSLIGGQVSEISGSRFALCSFSGNHASNAIGHKAISFNSALGQLGPVRLPSLSNQIFR